MSKAILVLDNMPVHCDQCPLWEDHDDWDEKVGRCIIEDGARSRTYGRPLWCPLKEMPERRFEENFDWTDLTQKENAAINHGWNKCLGELEDME